MLGSTGHITKNEDPYVTDKPNSQLKKSITWFLLFLIQRNAHETVPRRIIEAVLDNYK